MTTEQFFKIYPLAPQLLKVGNQYFLQNSIESAKNKARITKSKLEIITNPNLKPSKKDTKNG